MAFQEFQLLPFTTLEAPYPGAIEEPVVTLNPGTVFNSVLNIVIDVTRWDIVDSLGEPTGQDDATGLTLVYQGEFGEQNKMITLGTHIIGSVQNRTLELRAPPRIKLLWNWEYSDDLVAEVGDPAPNFLGECDLEIWAFR